MRPIPRHRSSRAAWLALVLGAVVAAGYAHTLGYGFHFDDFSNIRDNPALRDPFDLGAIARFRPARTVLDLSLAWNAELTGFEPWGFRLGNLLIHFLSAALVAWTAGTLARRLDPAGGESRARRMAWAAGLLFAAHPLATQAVTYIIQRTASLATLFELGSLAAYLRARESGRFGDWLACWASAALATFTKEMAAALPLLLLVVEAFLRRAERGRAPEPGRPRLAHALPFVMLLAALALVASLPSAKRPAGVHDLRETVEISRATYLRTELTVVPRYLGLALWPRGQSLDPDAPLKPRADAAVVAGAALLLAVLGGAWALRRRAPLASLGIFATIVLLLPESSLVPIRDVMVEHRMYAPLVGLSWAGAALFVSSTLRGRAGAGALAAVVAALTIATHQRNRVWRDEVALWSDVTAKAPQRERGWNNLALALEAAGRPGDAEAAYGKAIAIAPDYEYALVNLGRLAGQSGRLDEARALLERALRVNPSGPEALTNLGAVHLAAGDTAGALALWRHALEVAPAAPEARRALERFAPASAPPSP